MGNFEYSTRWYIKAYQPFLTKSILMQKRHLLNRTPKDCKYRSFRILGLASLEKKDISIEIL